MFVRRLGANTVQNGTEKGPEMQNLVTNHLNSETHLESMMCLYSHGLRIETTFLGGTKYKCLCCIEGI